MGHGARGIDLFHAESYGLSFEETYPDWQEAITLGVPEDHDGQIGGWIQDETFDLDDNGVLGWRGRAGHGRYCARQGRHGQAMVSAATFQAITGKRGTGRSERRPSRL